MGIEDKYSYDPATGLLTFKATGKRAGWESGNGYLKVDYAGKKYYAHRVAWYITHGNWPEEIDHINGSRCDNRLENLRPASRQDNVYNSPKRSHSTQPYKGVRLEKSGRWLARIRVANKPLSLGRFDTAEEAYEAYIFAALEHHGEYARLT